MARLARRLIVDEDQVGVFHICQRVVRRSHLCGTDSVSGKCYDYRREWIQKRLAFLASVFGIDVLAFAVMSNHLHLVLRNRPDVVAKWSDEEVAWRWWNLFPKRKDKQGQPMPPRPSDLDMIQADPQQLAEKRRRLSSISWWMRCLGEDIARRANKEDECTGHFWEGRFKSQPLLDESAIVACMAYVDLNPIRARLAETPETSQFTSAYERIAARQSSINNAVSESTVTEAPQAIPPESARDAWLAPIEVLSESAEQQAPPTTLRASSRGCLPMKQDQYLQLLDWTGRQIRRDKRGAIPSDLAPILERLQTSPEHWVRLVSSFRRLFHRAVGRESSLQQEANRRGQTYLRGMPASREVFNPASVGKP